MHLQLEPGHFENMHISGRSEYIIIYMSTVNQPFKEM